MRSTKSKMRKVLTKKIKVFLIFYVALVVLYFTSISISRFMSEANGSGDSVVARWHVEADIDTEEVDLINGANMCTCTLTVLSTSEISCTYSVVLSNIPDGLEVAIDEGEFVTPTDNIASFENVGAFSTNNEVANEHTLKFRAPLEIDEEIDRIINVDVIFVQDELI